MSKKISIGILGVGGHGGTIRRAIKACDNFTIVSCFDPNEAALKEAVEELGCEPAVSDEAVLTDPRTQAVAIVSPNHLHRQHAEQAAAHGKHIFLEKPIANTVEDGQAIVAVARQAGVILQVGHHVRKYPVFRFAKEQIDSGKLGTLVGAEGNFTSPSGLDKNVPAWKTRKTSCPVVPLMQLGIHGIDTLQYLLGPIVEGTSFQRHALMPGDTLDSSVSLFRFQNNLLGTFSSHYVARHAFYLNLFGTEYNLYMTFNSARLERLENWQEEHLTTTFTQPGDEPYKEEIREFASCILENREPEVPGEMGLQNLLVLEALIRSAEEHRSMAVETVA
ncbi:MAG: Gfo/Idh/MocA family oxidoreductase [Calditrichaeota bacterium]|nr:Gfo/Idh/MocA family oxidoreductase [Calditrichota bacterium]